MERTRREVLQSSIALGAGSLLAGCNSNSDCHAATAAFDNGDGDKFWLGAFFPLAVDADTQKSITNPEPYQWLPNRNSIDSAEAIITPNDETTIDAGSVGLNDDYTYVNLKIPVQIIWDSTFEDNSGIDVTVDVSPNKEQAEYVFRARDTSHLHGFRTKVPLANDRQFKLEEQTSKADIATGAVGRVRYGITDESESSDSITDGGQDLLRIDSGFMLPVDVSIQVDFSDNCEVPLGTFPADESVTTRMMIPTWGGNYDFPSEILDSTEASITILEEYGADWAESGADAAQLTALHANQDDLSDDQLDTGVTVAREGVAAVEKELEKQKDEYKSYFSHPGGPTLRLNTRMEESETATPTQTPSPTPTATPTPSPTATPTPCNITAADNYTQPLTNAQNTSYSPTESGFADPTTRPTVGAPVDISRRDGEERCTLLYDGSLIVATNKYVYIYDACNITATPSRITPTTAGPDAFTSIERLAVHDDLLYVGGRAGNRREAKGKLSAFSLDGDYVEAENSDLIGERVSSLTVFDDHVYALTEGGAAFERPAGLYKYSPLLEEKTQLVKRPDYAKYTPAISPKAIVLSGTTGARGYTQAYTHTGEEMWESPLTGGSVNSPPIISDDTAYQAQGDVLYSLTLESGRVDAKVGLSGQAYSPATLTSEFILQGTSAGVDVIDRQKQERLSTLETESTVFAAPLVVADRVYVLTDTGMFYGWDLDYPSSPTHLWPGVDTGVGNPSSANEMARPMMAGNRMFIAQKTRLVELS